MAPCIRCGGKPKQKRQRICKDCWLAQRRAGYKANPDLHKEAVRLQRIKRKLAVLAHYGGKCACCEEKNYKFLTIDHVDGGGNKHRRDVVGLSRNFYDWLIENNFPEGFQVLCYNCNCGRAHNKGTCPHKE